MDRGADGHPEVEAQARIEHLKVVVRHGLIIFLANISASITLVAGLWHAIPPERLTAWFCAMLLLSLFRWSRAYRLARFPPDPGQIGRQETLFLAATGMSGLMWGITAVVFYIPNNPMYSMFLALMLVGMGAASTSLLSFQRLAFPVYVLPIILPLEIQLLAEGGQAHVAVAAVIPIYFCLLFVMSRRIFKFSNDSIISGLVSERQALVDHLTGIPNRRAFEEFLQREWSRGIRTRCPVSLIVADIDDFKRYNDTYGHQTGDEVLRTIAELLRDSARRGTDLVARVGGEEFAIVSPDTDTHGSAIIVENIRRNRAQLARDISGAWQVPTLSFGISSMVADTDRSFFTLFEQADAALYEAKAAGKNCTVTRAAPAPHPRSQPSGSAR